MENIKKLQKINFPCPCGGKINWFKERIIREGIDCGVLDVERCDKCGEEYLPEWSMNVVENKLSDAGLWGVERKEIKFWKSGNAVVLRLPAELSRKLGLINIKKGYAYQEGQHKIAIDF
jgi:hypothetical protein